MHHLGDHRKWCDAYSPGSSLQSLMIDTKYQLWAPMNILIGKDDVIGTRRMLKAIESMILIATHGFNISDHPNVSFYGNHWEDSVFIHHLFHFPRKNHVCVPLGFPFNFHWHFVSTGKRKREWGIELRNHTENEFSIRNTSYMFVCFSEAKVDRSSSTCATSTDAPSFTWNSVSLLRDSRNLDSLCITSSSVTKPDRWKDSMLSITWSIKL